MDDSIKYCVWVYDHEWVKSGGEPADGSGLTVDQANEEYYTMLKEYGWSQIMILPIGMEIVNEEDECGNCRFIVKAR